MEKEDELDITSEKFNPLKALYSEKLKQSQKNVKRFDNLSIFEARLKVAGEIDKDLSTLPSTSKKTPKVLQEEDEKYHITHAGRKFLKEQAPVSRGKKSKFTRDLLHRMESSKGPIALLQKFRVDQKEVKVYTRNGHGIRGYLIGYIVAFDKHYNITLIECTETWKRRKYKFSEGKVLCKNQPQDCSKLLAKMGIEVPEITVRSLNRKYVECSRKLGQIMVRGEDVVLVSEFIRNAQE